MQNTKKARCRHDRNSWLLLDDTTRGKIDITHRIEWCFVCGAMRVITIVEDKTCQTTTRPMVDVLTSSWALPTGDRKNNPFKKWNLKNKYLSTMYE